MAGGRALDLLQQCGDPRVKPLMREGDGGGEWDGFWHGGSSRLVVVREDRGGRGRGDKLTRVQPGVAVALWHVGPACRRRNGYWKRHNCMAADDHCLPVPEVGKE